jgi:hypothetical protein
MPEFSLIGRRPTPKLLTTKEAAHFLRLSPGTLENWRTFKRYNLPYTKVGTKIYYDANDLVDWLASRKVKSS